MPGPMVQRRTWMRVLLSLLALGAGLVPAQTARASQGDSQTLLYVGTTRIFIEDASSDGTTFGFNYGYEVVDNLLWKTGLAFTSTDGQQSVGSTQYAIHANTTTVQTGLTYYFNRTPTSLVVPFVGGGVALVNYDVDYQYPGSKVGKASGAGPGAFVQAGIELWIARNFTLILDYEIAASQMQTQSGSTDTLGSGGLLLSLRINIY